MSAGYVVRLRGLPWTAKQSEIVEFLRECNIKNGEDGIHFTFSREARPSGEAFVELESEEDVTHALAQNRENIGNRYIEVFRVDKSEMDWTIKHSGAGAIANQKNPDAVVKLRGLPFGCSKEEIAQFFTTLVIVPNGIMLPEDRNGRSTGEAFVQFASPAIADKALEKHKERIGHRYIEIFKSSLAEANAVARGVMRSMMGPRPGPYDRGDRGFNMGVGMNAMMNMGYGRGRGRNVKGYFEEDYDDYNFSDGMGYGMRNRRSGGGGGGGNGRGGMGMAMDRGGRATPGSMYVSKTGHSVHLRGLPFSATVDDVYEFFSPIQPVRCELEVGESGKPNGEANADFVSHQEALDAMKKHKCHMQHRYIELFLNSEPPRNNSGGGGGYGNGMGGAGNFGGMASIGNNDFQEDMGAGGFGQSNSAGYGGGYGSGGQGFGGGNQSGFGNQGNSGFGNNSGYGNQGMNSYDVGGGYGDGMGNSGGMMSNNYTAF